MKQEVQKQGELMLPFRRQLGSETVEASAEEIYEWWDLSMDAGMWWKRQAVRPRDAAMLLCRMNPLTEKAPESMTTDQTGPHDYARLLSTFDDLERANPQSRSLSDWRQVAQQDGLKYHSWIDEWLACRRSDGMTQQDCTGPKPLAPTKKRTHRLKAKRNLLDPVLDAAIQKAGSNELATVSVALKELAVNGVAPFTGEVQGGALYYTNSKNQIAFLTQDALRKRLNRRTENAE